MHDYLIGRFTVNTSLAYYYCHNGPLHIYRIMHIIIDIQKDHGISFCVLDQIKHYVCISGVDHIHAATVVVNELEGKSDIVFGFLSIA